MLQLEPREAWLLTVSFCWLGEVGTAAQEEVSTGILAELQQLSAQVVQHAATLLKSGRVDNTAGSGGGQQAGLPEDHPRAQVLPDFWLVISPLMPTLAVYAPQPSLQHFVSQLVSCIVPDPLPPSGTASGEVESSAAGSASGSASDAAVARVIAGCLGHGSFLEQPQLQQAWVRAVQLDLTTAVTKLNSAITSSSESLEPPHRDTSKKHRKSQGMQPGKDQCQTAGTSEGTTEGLSSKHYGTATDGEVHQLLMHTLQVVTPFLAAAPKPDVTLSVDAEQGRHTPGSTSKASSAGKKRKTTEMLSPGEATQSATPLLRHVAGLLEHVALMPLGMLSTTNAAVLAQLLLHTQLLLARAAVALATTAAANAQAGDALRLTTQALVSSQQGMVKCLKSNSSSDAAAAGFLHAGPQLWHWQPAMVQLASHMQVILSPSRVSKVPGAFTPHPQAGSSMSVSISLQHSLPAGSARDPGSWANAASCMVPEHSVSITMLEEMSVSIRCLACYCFGVRQAAGARPTADMVSADCTAAGTADDEVIVGFQAFVAALASELQVRILV